MRIGDVVVHKNNFDKISNNKTKDIMIGYVYKKSCDEVKVAWNASLNDWEDADKLIVVDMLDLDYIKIFFTLYTSNRLKHVSTSFEGYVDWARINNGFDYCPNEYIKINEFKYGKVEFLSYEGNKIIDSKFERAFIKVYEKGKYAIYKALILGFIYEENRVYYLVDKEKAEVYYAGLENEYNHEGCEILNYKTLKKDLQEYYSVSN